jgi:SAM-dependent MidA family methyltransferase
VSAAEAIARRIRREGPIPFETFMELALYDDDGGFFATGGGAGRAGRDFITSPEVGALFGMCVARAIDEQWENLDSPDPFLVVEAGAGRGRLAREVLRAAPDCAPALRYVLVERSAALRAEQHELLAIEPADEALGPFFDRSAEQERVPVPAIGPIVASLPDLPALTFDGVVVANELLDNLPFGIAAFDGERWQEVRIALDDASFVEVLVPTEEPPGIADVARGTRVPIPHGLVMWLEECARMLRRGTVILLDYVTDEPREGWLRTYREHGVGSDVLDAPGLQDITADIVFPQLEWAAQRAGLRVVDRRSQADWLRALGIDELAEEGRRIWDEGAHRGDLAAIAGRSRVHEAAALTDPSGLGAHDVITLAR